MCSIAEAKTKWEFIGLSLKIDPEELEAIKYDCCSKVDECFKEMLKVWLKKVTPPPSWEGLINALQSKMVSHSKLAESLAKEHNIQLQGRILGH